MANSTSTTSQNSTMKRIQEAVTSKLPQRGYLICLTEPSPENFYGSPIGSPIGLVSKSLDGKQTGWRTIFDLSSPEGHSVNNGIPKHYGSIVYETLNDAIQLVAQAGKGAVMMKRDVKSAFRHISINSCDYWLLLFECISLEGTLARKHYWSLLSTIFVLASYKK